MDTSGGIMALNEVEFDQEFDLEKMTQIIVNKAKSDVRAKYGKKKRHRQ